MKVRLSENQYNIYKTYLKENQESDSQKKAVDYLIKNYYDNATSDFIKKDVEKFVRVVLRSKVGVLNANKKAGKFTLGCLRLIDDMDCINCNIYDGLSFEPLIDSDEPKIAKKINSLNKIINYICSNEEIYNKMDKNLNNYTFAKLSSLYKEQHFQSNRKESNRVFGQTKYKIVQIKNYEEASRYSKLVSWCITHSENSFNNYTNFGSNTFYFCFAPGFTNVEEEDFDDYAQSALAICVDADGDLVSCTSRFNHDKDLDDHYCKTVEEVENIVGVDFYKTFKPKDDYYMKYGFSDLMSKINSIKTVGDFRETAETIRKTPFSADISFSDYGLYIIKLRDFGYIYSLQTERNLEGFTESNGGYLKKICEFDGEDDIYVNKGVILYKTLDGYVTICDFDGNDINNELNKKIKEKCKLSKRSYYTRNFNLDLYGTRNQIVDGNKFIKIDNELYTFEGKKVITVDNVFDGEKAKVSFITVHLNYEGKILIAASIQQIGAIYENVYVYYDPQNNFKKLLTIDSMHSRDILDSETIFFYEDDSSEERPCYIYDSENVIKYEHRVNPKNFILTNRIQMLGLYNNKNDVTLYISIINEKVIKLYHLSVEDVENATIVNDNILRINVRGKTENIEL